MLFRITSLKENRKIVLTGSTGYIGTNLLKNLSSLKENIIITKRTSETQYDFYGLDNKVFELCQFRDSEIILIHLATFFSKDKQDINKIHYANIDFGKDVVNKLNEFNLKKVIYTNTMYCFYADSQIRNLEYTKSKITFSEFLKNLAYEKLFLLEEIFLDNSYGNIDSRPKIIPLIMQAVVGDQENPIKNPDAFINLVHVDKIVERLIISINSEALGSSAFISSFSFNLKSMYNFLKKYRISNKIDNNLIIEQPNNYINSHPKIDLKNIPLGNLSYDLINELKNYES